MDEERWRNLDIWKLADELAYKTYLLTREFPRDEIYGITAQIRRAALSVPTNIVEGYARKGDKELGRFLNISLGSLAEVKYLLYFCRRLGYVANEQYEEISSNYERLGKSLWKFYEKIRKE